MNVLERTILVTKGGETETNCLTDDIAMNNGMAMKICDQMRNGSWVTFNFKMYLPYRLFHFVSDLYNRFPDSIDLKIVGNHIEQYRIWAIGENERVAREKMEILLRNLEKAASRN